jgi:nucleotide-binding universal stress UspA family protein
MRAEPAIALSDVVTLLRSSEVALKEDDFRMQQSIVVGVNGLEHEPHLEWAIVAAKLWSSDLLVVHCFEGSLDPEIPDPDQMSRHRAENVLERSVSNALSNGIRAEPRLSEGFPGKVLVEVSEGARLLVIGSSHRSRLSHAMHASISTYCVRHAQCPVTIVPTHN